jgi:hypothetical protein
MSAISPPGRGHRASWLAMSTAAEAIGIGWVIRHGLFDAIRRDCDYADMETRSGVKIAVQDTKILAAGAHNEAH